MPFVEKRYSGKGSALPGDCECDCGRASSVPPAGSKPAARIDEIRAELKRDCPSEAYHADSMFEAERTANRWMDRSAELIAYLDRL